MKIFSLTLFHSKQDIRIPTLPLDKTRNGALLSHKVICQVLNTTLEEWDDLSSTAQNAKYQEATGVYDIVYTTSYAYADKYLKVL